MRFSGLFVALSVLVLGAIGFDNSRYDNVSATRIIVVGGAGRCILHHQY